MASADGALEPMAAAEPAGGGLTALHAACDAGDTSAITQLLQHASAQVNARDADDRTPLKVAALRGHTEAAALLLAHGAKIGDGDEASARRAALGRQWSWQPAAAVASRDGRSDGC
jgi:ankyrin repeat protein